MAGTFEGSLQVNIQATPNNYGVTHIAIESLPTSAAWTRGRLVRKYTGYPQNVNDGVVIADFTNNNFVLQVTTVSTGVITGVAVKNVGTYATTSTVVASSNIAGVGTGATFTVSTNSVTLTSGGSGYAVNDLIVLPYSSINSSYTQTYQPNSYGLYGLKHYYDTVGGITATTTNPATVAASVTPTDTRAYYSFFLDYFDKNITSYCILSGKASSVLVKDTGLHQYLLDHLPAFYQRISQVGDSNDLVDFLKVFAFQLEVYKTQTTNVFKLTSTATSDEELLKLLLKQLGVKSADIPDIAQGRELARNIIKSYKESGSYRGVGTTIEAYTGYGATITKGRNIIHDYNTSSFETGTGFWYLDPASTSASGYFPTLTATAPVVGSVVAFNNGATGYGATGPSVISASWSTSGTTITGVFSSDLKPGAALSTASGTGVLVNPTYVTAITGTNTFSITPPATTGTTSATLRASTNLIGGMGVVVGATTTATTASFYIGPKRALTTGAVTASTIANIRPNTAAVNDYVIGTNVPWGTYVVSATSPTATQQVLTLSSAISATSGETLYFSRNAKDKIGALPAWLPVIASAPYTFSMYVNQGSLTANTASAKISWYDRSGNVISTSSTGTNASITATAGTTNKWLPIVVQGLAPSNAVYAEPAFSITNVTNATSWYVDAAQFEVGSSVSFKEITTATTVQLTTPTPHYFSTTRTATLTGSNYIVVNGLGTPYDGTFAVSSTPTPLTVQYNIPSTSVVAMTPVTGGYVSAQTPYDEAKSVTIKLTPSRKNLITNPSFESAAFTGGATTTHNWAATNATIAASTSPTLSGSNSLKVTSTGASAMTVTGYAGAVSSGAFINGTDPFSVTTPTSTNPTVYYTFSFYMQTSGTQRNVTASINWNVGTASTSVISSTSYAAGSWVRHSVVGAVPVGASTATVSISVASTGAGEIYYIDDVLLETGSTLRPYFDGSYDGQSYTKNKDSVWEVGGVPNGCASYLYNNRVGGLNRLKGILSNEVFGA